MAEQLADILKQIQNQNHQENLAIQNLIAKLFKEGKSEVAEHSSSTSKPTESEFIIEALASNITEFCHDPENNIIFDTWYMRYEDLFLIDAAKLDDAAKTRLLLRKLNTIVHNKYINYILPNHSRDFTFKDTVEKLKKLFGNQISLFNTRFNCLQITKQPTQDFVTYASMVNKQCELFKLNDLTTDQFKCLIFIMGLKSPSEFELRTKMLNKLENESTKVTLETLSTECQKILNLKVDTMLIESNAQVNRLRVNNHKTEKQIKNNGKSKEPSSLPKTPCWFCGEFHYSRHCPFKNHKCDRCKLVGHKEGYCKYRKTQNENQKYHKIDKGRQFNSKSIFTTNKVNMIKRKYILVKINGTPLNLQLDTASDITIISEDNFKKIKADNVSESEHTARSATDELPLSAKFKCNVEFRNQQQSLTCFVTPIQNLNVMGLDWIQELNLCNMSINSICNSICENQDSIQLCSNPNKDTHLKHFFSDVFDGKMGLCTKTKAVITTKPNVQPVFRSKRPVAYAVQQLVEDELKRLQELKVISPVNFSAWAAPIVVVKKTNGNVRICADFSTGLNNCLESHQYPLPLPEDIFSKLANSKIFSHIDLSDAFLQIEVDDASKHLLTINTHIRLFQYNRMVFGIKTFPAIFQQIMDQMLAGLNCTASYIDDIFVSGKTASEHTDNLYAVLTRVRDYGFKLKYEKCNFFKTEIKYLGYIINQEGLKPDPERIAAIKQMPEPSNITELRSFLGAINFYGKFVPKMRELRGQLDNLLKLNVKWKWDAKLIVAADASNYGLGACIMHEYSDRSIKPICHASRSLTPAEQKYSQIEKEGLALIFAVTKFHKMLYGRRFILHTDHKPLLTIFGRKTGIAIRQANRLQRWAIQLLAYDFEIRFISTNSFGYADVLSRLINNNENISENYVVASIKLERSVNSIIVNTINALPVTHKMITYETAKDPILKQIIYYITNGWPNKTINNRELQAFLHRKNELSLINECVVYGERIVVPQVYKKRVLKQLHRGYQGIERTKALARSFVYWPNIDTDIKTFIQNCNQCANAAKMPTKTLLHSWPTPSEQWERVHIDFA
ncbi:uncharacterized protein K02A2.6-like [Teleopsis dalmanni]|uniref:uncharacterized protein K02A2.6-like n=1 Tax=Teleopsis dalmanni TaxID=139649 RepID=UPI0018CECA6A|nr:uncharacterized protein K02A2.6-like [Teleopsis dalmanni]